MSLFKKKEKRIEFYAVGTYKNPKAVLTMTDNINEAGEYIETLLAIEHSTHYENWCSLRNLDPNDDSIWKDYLKNVVSNEEKAEYRVFKLSYNRKGLAAMLRQLINYIPLGCSYETEDEEKQFYDNLEKFKNGVTDGE